MDRVVHEVELGKLVESKPAREPRTYVEEHPLEAVAAKYEEWCREQYRSILSERKGT